METADKDTYRRNRRVLNDGGGRPTMKLQTSKILRTRPGTAPTPSNRSSSANATGTSIRPRSGGAGSSAHGARALTRSGSSPLPAAEAAKRSKRAAGTGAEAQQQQHEVARQGASKPPVVLAKPVKLKAADAQSDLPSQRSFFDREAAFREAMLQVAEREEAMRRHLIEMRRTALLEAERFDVMRRTALEAVWTGRRAPVSEVAWTGRLGKHVERLTIPDTYRAPESIDDTSMHVAVIPNTEYLGYGHLCGQRTKLRTTSPLRAQLEASSPARAAPVRSSSSSDTVLVQLLRPIVDAADNHIFRAVEPLKLRDAYDLESEPSSAGHLAAGALVRVVERHTLPNGVERAAVARVGVHEGTLGWITVAREEEKKALSARRHSMKRYAAAARLGAAAAAGAPSPEAGSPASAPAAAPADDKVTAASKDKSLDKPAPKKGVSKAERKAMAAAAGSLVPSQELDIALLQLLMELQAHEAKFDESKKTLSVKLGELLMAKQIKIPEMVTQWAKRGVEPITKFEFRLNVRKLMEQANAKDVDALFDKFDDDHGGSLDVAELKKALKALKDSAVDAARSEAETRELMAQLQARVEQARQVMSKTKASEEAEIKLEALRNNKSVGARLGQLLVTRNLKVTDLIVSWDADGTGEVDKKEFAHHVKGVGLQAEDAEINGLFESLDEDGGGTLDMTEVKHALKTLQDAASDADLEITRLKKATVELWKTAKSAQVEFKKVQKADELAAADKQAAVEAEIAKRAAIELQHRLAREQAALERRKAAEEERRAFEAKIAARRKATQEKEEAEMKAFGGGGGEVQALTSFGSVRSGASG